jgi:UDP-2-acetamido-2-deoxy-ribo-hexuluronate aminotransferase
MREIRVHGQSERYVHPRVGLGGRMDTIQSAILLSKLEIFDWEIQKRLEIGAKFNSLFAGKVRTVVQRKDRTSVFAQYTIFVKNRSQLQAHLKGEDIPTAVHYPVPMHMQPAYEHLCCAECSPEAVMSSAHVLSLPMGPFLDELSIEKIVACLLGNL